MELKPALLRSASCMLCRCQSPLLLAGHVQLVYNPTSFRPVKFILCGSHRNVLMSATVYIPEYSLCWPSFCRNRSAISPRCYTVNET
ncbi:hypothetical protein POUND7_020402 [Theobroma cacao]